MPHPMIGECGFADVIFKKASRYSPKSIIELGCGNGGNLAKFSCEKKVGIDPCEENNPMILGDHTYLENYSINEFDLGFTCSVLDHIEDWERALSDMMRICKDVMLIEPYVGKERQAKKKETFRWKETWYHDYVSFLEGFKYEVEKYPLYKNNSGKFFHIFYIKT